MNIHDEAKIIVNKIEQKLDSILILYGFKEKWKKSNPDIFSEILSYQKDKYIIEIIICLHPHDYPNAATVILRKHDNENSVHINLRTLLQRTNQTEIPAFNLFPKSDTEKTVTEICTSLDFILSANYFEDLDSMPLT
jgi:hypothetical protein